MNAPRPLALKVDHLVALMSVAIGDKAHHTHRQNPIPLTDITGGILDYDEGKKRTFPILDALASICVSNPEKQVVALGLQLKLSEGKLCLTIAQNEQVKSGLVNYLQQVWSMLQGMSVKFKAKRSALGQTAESEQYRRVSPNIPDDVAWDSRIRLFRCIYLYTRDKNQKRVKKPLDTLAEFMERFYKSQGTQHTGSRADLDFAFRALRGAYKNFDSKVTVPQDDRFWESLYALLEEATCAVTRIIQNHPVFCSVLVNEVALDNERKNSVVFDLGHALQKLTSQHRNIQCLIAFANSPRLQSVLGCQLTIITVPANPKRPIALPLLAVNWKEIIQTMVPPHKSVGGKWVEKEAASLVSALAKHRNVNAPVHCECALIEYYTKGAKSTRGLNRVPKVSNATTVPLGYRCEENRQPASGRADEWKVVGRKEGSARSVKVSDQWKLVPPFNYIGVSKLSCAACQMWMDGYNKRGGKTFYTRGSHGKWYFPWATPRVGERELSHYMISEITRTYYEHCRANERVRRLSDGSNSGMDHLGTSGKRRTQDLASALLETMRL
ncbi:hypothetical protein B9Z19DRAFT_1062375 [Tuber borchii]|uniref:Uncharacterized protein n=1 Tax=Tuber borchii TaxID=42251 RepID=A0A2T7A259_TUBBO|nr:hypothetical protein B9Z19DRAFT_1062375 [Tuber borchii]